MRVTVSFNFSCRLLGRLRKEGLKSVKRSCRAATRLYDREAPDSMRAERKRCSKWRICFPPPIGDPSLPLLTVLSRTLNEVEPHPEHVLDVLPLRRPFGVYAIAS